MLIQAFNCWHTWKVAFDYHIYLDQWSPSDITEMTSPTPGTAAGFLRISDLTVA